MKGMNLFASPNSSAQGLFDENFDHFRELDQIAFIRQMKKEMKNRNEITLKGRDRLLELNSHRPEISTAIVHDISKNEGGSDLEMYMEKIFPSLRSSSQNHSMTVSQLLNQPRQCSGMSPSVRKPLIIFIIPNYPKTV